MKTTETYSSITGQSIGPKVLDWIHDLEERYGEPAVLKTMEDVAETGKLERFLDQVSKRLASRAAMARRHTTPHELDRETLLAMVRGQIAEPDRPFIYDTRPLTPAEYDEVVAWSIRSERGVAIGTSS